MQKPSCLWGCIAVGSIFSTPRHCQLMVPDQCFHGGKQADARQWFGAVQVEERDHNFEPDELRQSDRSLKFYCITNPKSLIRLPQNQRRLVNLHNLGSQIAVTTTFIKESSLRTGSKCSAAHRIASIGDFQVAKSTTQVLETCLTPIFYRQVVERRKKNRPKGKSPV